MGLQNTARPLPHVSPPRKRARWRTRVPFTLTLTSWLWRGRSAAVPACYKCHLWPGSNPRTRQPTQCNSTQRKQGPVSMDNPFLPCTMQLKVGLTDSSSICREMLRDRGRQHEKAVNKPTVRPGQAPGLTPCPFQVQARGTKQDKKPKHR